MTMTNAERAAYNALSAKLQRQARNNGHDHPHKFEAGPDPVSAEPTTLKGDGPDYVYRSDELRIAPEGQRPNVTAAVHSFGDGLVWLRLHVWGLDVTTMGSPEAMRALGQSLCAAADVGRSAMTSLLATHCHGYGGKCPREVTVYRGKLRLCTQCDVNPPDREPLPRTRDPEGEARAKLRVRDYDDPHNEVARNAPH